MPKILNDLPEVKRPGRKPKYDYESLFSHGSKAVQITKGEDFDCSVGTMRHNLYREADKRNKSLATVTNDENTLSFKVLPKRTKKAKK
jgi:hypothetical protein